MCGAVVGVKGARAKIGRFDGLADYMRFANPGALCVREDDGDGVPCCLEGLDEGVDVG